MDLSHKISEFFQRIQARIEEDAFPKELNGLIKKEDLIEIYEYIASEKEFVEYRLKQNKPLRLAKERTKFSRTLNFIYENGTQKIRLLIETKRKNASNVKTETQEVFRGGSKKIKPAWAIDEAKPQKFANATIRFRHIEEYNDLSKEYTILANAITTHPELGRFVNALSLGSILEKTKEYKISLYSPWANRYHLKDFLMTEEGMSLSMQQKNNFALQLIQAVKTLHAVGIYHQDIKLDNILVFENEQGTYQLKLIDFGAAYYIDKPTLNKKDILTSAGMESPELSVMQRDPKACYHDYYYKKQNTCYGRELAGNLQPLPEYALPHEKNDTWALGIVLYQLYFSEAPNIKKVTQVPALIAGLLQQDRKARFTAQEALECWEKEVAAVNHHHEPNIMRVIPAFEIDAFFKRVSEKQQSQTPLPDELSKLIQQSDLNAIYDYVLKKQAFLTAKLEQGKPWRFDKKETGLARTVNLVFDPLTDKIRLVLETKSKNVLHQKVPSQPNEFDVNGTIKPAWAIEDEYSKLANTVSYLNTQKGIVTVKRNASVAIDLIKKYPDKKVFFNLASVGRTINKKGERDKRPYAKKLSVYTNWTNQSTLREFLKTAEGSSLSIQQLNEIAFQLTTAIDTLHESGRIHQEINTRNVLISQHPDGSLQVVLADYGAVYSKNLPDINKVASATYGYESPEISIITKDPQALNHSYFHPKGLWLSYGLMLNEDLVAEPEYAVPNEANDMWALGIVLHELLNHRRPIESDQKHFPPLIAGLLDPIRETRLTAKQLLAQLEKTPIFSRANNENKIVQLFYQVKKRRAEKKHLPEELKTLIKVEELDNIYSYIIKNEKTLRILLEQGKPCRLDKIETHLTRTVNLVFDSKTNDIRVMLETKQKNQYGVKDRSIQKLSGTSKAIKPAWSIEGPVFKKYANAASYFKGHNTFSSTAREIHFATDIVKQHPVKQTYLNTVSIGKIIHKQGKKDKTSYNGKVSLYSPWASRDLCDFMKSPQGHALIKKEVDILAFQLLQAVKELHDADVIHQDLKPENILLYEEIRGKYRIELGDFGAACYKNATDFHSLNMLTTIMYESPEISLFRKNPRDSNYAYYYNQHYYSYGRELANHLQLRSDYAKPSKANDMWAIGIILYLLYHKKMPRHQALEPLPPLLAGLLCLDRDKRFTVDQALALFFSETIESSVTGKENTPPAFVRNIGKIPSFERKRSDTDFSATFCPKLESMHISSSKKGNKLGNPEIQQVPSLTL